MPVGSQGKATSFDSHPSPGAGVEAIEEGCVDRNRRVEIQKVRETWNEHGALKKLGLLCASSFAQDKPIWTGGMLNGRAWESFPSVDTSDPAIEGHSKSGQCNY